MTQDRRGSELKKLSDVVAKLTAPPIVLASWSSCRGRRGSNRGGWAEYYANTDPRLPVEDLKIGTQILVNEAYTVIKALGYDRNGPVLKVAELLPDNRIRFEQDMGRQALILQRSSDLVGADLKPGDEVRLSRLTALPSKIRKPTGARPSTGRSAERDVGANRRPTSGDRGHSESD